MTGTFLRVVPDTRTVTVCNSAAVLDINLVSFMFPRKIFSLCLVIALFLFLFLYLYLAKVAHRAKVNKK